MARNPKSEAEKPDAKQPEPEAPAPAAKDAEVKRPDPEASAPVPDAETTAAATGAEVPETKQPEAEKPAPEVEAEKSKAEAEAPEIKQPASMASGAAMMVAVITATVARRRRAGRSFGLTPVRIPVDELTDGDCAALADDPLLKIRLEPAEEPAGE